MIHALTQLGVIAMTLSAASEPLFDASADAKKLQTFRAAGLAGKAVGTVYPAGALEQGGMPLGGLGTGYLCLDTTGRFGKTAIFNRYPKEGNVTNPNSS